MNSSNRVGICVDWIEKYGGAENVLKSILDIYPNSEIWTLWCNDKEYYRQRGIKVFESPLAKVPVKFRKPLSVIFAPFFWCNLPDRQYKMTLISSHQFAHFAHFKGNLNPILGYIHTPVRYIWHPEVDRRLQKLRPLLYFLRLMDKRFNSTQIIAVNSIVVQKRVKSAWQLESKVIYPPADIVDLRPSEVVKNESGDEYLVSAGRWVPYKRFDLAIDVAEKSGHSLKIMGGGPERSRLLKKIEATSTLVELIENPSNEEYVEYLKGAKALIFPGIEDFGIVPVEAMQLGVPVIGIKAGGLIETVIDGTSGFLCSDLDEIVASINKVHFLSREDIIKQGNTFNSVIFRSSFEKWVKESFPE